MFQAYTRISRFSPFSLPLHTSCLTSSHPPCPSQTGEEEQGTAVKEEEWRESTCYEGNWCRNFEAGCPSCRQPVLKTSMHWNSSFLQPPTDSWGKGRRSRSHLRLGVGIQTHLNIVSIKCYHAFIQKALSVTEYGEPVFMSNSCIIYTLFRINAVTRHTQNVKT